MRYAVHSYKKCYTVLRNVPLQAVLRTPRPTPRTTPWTKRALQKARGVACLGVVILRVRYRLGAGHRRARGDRARGDAVRHALGDGVSPGERQAVAWVFRRRRIGDFGRGSRPHRSLPGGPERLSGLAFSALRSQETGEPAPGGYGSERWHHQRRPLSACGVAEGRLDHRCVLLLYVRVERE